MGVIMRVLFLSFAFLLASCSSSEVKDAAFAEVDRFHERYNAEDFAAILADADPEFSQDDTQSLEFFTAIREKFGAYQSSAEPNWKVNYHTAGNRVFLVYQSEFENGAVTEEFTFSFSGEEVALYGYHVNSPLLVSQ